MTKTDVIEKGYVIKKKLFGRVFEKKLETTVLEVWVLLKGSPCFLILFSPLRIREAEWTESEWVLT